MDSGLLAIMVGHHRTFWSAAATLTPVATGTRRTCVTQVLPSGMNLPPLWIW